MKNSKLLITILNGVTAVICCAAVAITGVVITDKIVGIDREIANISADTSVGDVSSSDDVYTEDSSVSADDNAFTDDSVATQDNTVAEDNSSANSDSVSSESADSSSSSSSSAPSAGTPGKVISPTSGLNSTDKAEVLKYYQMVMTKNEKDGLGHSQKMTLTKLDGGKGGVGGFISMFEPVAKSALADSSTSHEGLPGVHDKIKASDWASVKAVNDGKYTTVKIKLVEQTDDPYGKTSEGTVGRSIGVLDGVASALAKLNGLEADFGNGGLFLHYKNPQITIKVDNKTGSLVKGACSWSYDVHIDIREVAVKMSIFSLTLKDGEGIVNMVSSY